MKERLKNLPIWVLTGTNPAFYDMDSKTCIEQTARIYAKVREIVEDYNKFINDINKVVVEGNENYKEEISSLVHNYIAMLDTKISLATEYMMTNLDVNVRNVVEEMKQNGEISEAILEGFKGIDNRVKILENTDYTLTYNESNKELLFSKEVSE